MILGVYGDFSAAEMRGRIEKIFGSWPRGGRPKPAVIGVNAAAAAGKLHLVNKEDINQSTVRLGMQLVERNHPDFYPLNVMTAVLSDRMADNIRGAEGLAYMTFAAYAAEYDHASMWNAAGGTKSANTLKILESIKREIAGMSAAEVKPDELKRLRPNITTSTFLFAARALNRPQPLVMGSQEQGNQEKLNSPGLLSSCGIFTSRCR